MHFLRKYGVAPHGHNDAMFAKKLGEADIISVSDIIPEGNIICHRQTSLTPYEPTAHRGSWSGLRDSNPRSLGPKPSAIPNFAKPGAVDSLNIILDCYVKSKSENRKPFL